MEASLTPEQLAAIDKIQKLLNLAAKNTNEAEAASAAAKAQELLIRYNLDASAVEGKSDSGRREEAKVKGGFYVYQRDLWRAVATLNFCIYWTQAYVVRARGRVYKIRSDRYSGTETIEKLMNYKRHMVVGRLINTRATINMAQYLEQAIERLARERAPEAHHFSNWAVSFRKGCAARIVIRLMERRNELLAEERARQEAANRAASGASTSTALTVVTLTQQEYDANIDFIYGAGTSAKWAAERAERAKERAERLAAYTQWAAEHPEEAAAEKKKQDAAAEKASRQRSSRGRGDGTDWSAYYSGYDSADNISLNPQVDEAKATKRIGRS